MFVLECYCESREFEYRNEPTDGFYCERCGRFIEENDAGHFLIKVEE